MRNIFETLFLKTELKMSNKTQFSLVQLVKPFKIFMSHKQLVLRSVLCGFPIELYTISLQYKNANITNFALAVPFKIKKTSKVHNLEM